MLEYNSTVELVYQGTNLVEGENHPLHLHGYSFYVVGTGFGNFDKDKDPLAYNLVDPPKLETVGIPRNGWVAIRFKASNPGKLKLSLLSIKLIRIHLSLNQIDEMGIYIKILQNGFQWI